MAKTAFQASWTTNIFGRVTWFMGNSQFKSNFFCGATGTFTATYVLSEPETAWLY